MISRKSSARGNTKHYPPTMAKHPIWQHINKNTVTLALPTTNLYIPNDIYVGQSTDSLQSQISALKTRVDEQQNQIDALIAAVDQLTIS